MDKTRLLIVEDDNDIRALLVEFLTAEDYAVSTLASGRNIDDALRTEAPDLVILDIMLPGEDGFSICRRLRTKSDVPVLMLTAKRDDVDRIVGLEIGADDYLVKPFNPRELLARIRAILRRTADHVPDGAPGERHILSFSNILIDLDARSVRDADGMQIELTTAEFDLLACFAERPRRVLSRDQLLDWTRGRTHADPFDRTIDVTVSRLRARLAPYLPEGLEPITTVRNAGYLFALDVRKSTA
ncbi:response regulator [Martelella endophytica]|uniref:Transcriptional regulator n=1 Tax=Martelella endophytica TaxID=1486262 RepID=A0A0D5LW19_MAREN|nr:transcriptional regulator [Martelella endophytica]